MDMYKNINQNAGAWASTVHTYGTVRKVTSITREFDEEGRVVKEVETITEYSQPPSYPQYPHPVYPYTISSGTISSRTTN